MGCLSLGKLPIKINLIKCRHILHSILSIIMERKIVLVISLRTPAKRLLSFARPNHTTIKLGGELTFCCWCIRLWGLEFAQKAVEWNRCDAGISRAETRGLRGRRWFAPPWQIDVTRRRFGPANRTSRRARVQEEGHHLRLATLLPYTRQRTHARTEQIEHNQIYVVPEDAPAVYEKLRCKRRYSITASTSNIAKPRVL